MNKSLHIPVLLHEVLQTLEPKPGSLFVDGTFGNGGYSRAFLEAGAEVIALDCDPAAIAAGQDLVQQAQGRFTLLQKNFSQLKEIFDTEQKGRAPDAIILDIGVSSMQLDQALRGFSFQKDGPLDMRMSQQGPNAADVINEYSAKDLARIFYCLGEEKWARPIAYAIEKARQQQKICSTLALAQLIEKVRPKKFNERIHPATRVFQALRIYVNDELRALLQALFAAEQVLPPGGRLGVVSFHSLEDRIVKRFFASRSQKAMPSRYAPYQEGKEPSFSLLFKGVKAPQLQEIEHNPRARSAKLRVGVRRQALPYPAEEGFFSLPLLPPLKQISG